MLKRKFSWGAATLLSVFVAACGGGGGNPGEPGNAQRAEVLMVDGYTAPETTTMEITGVRKRSASERPPTPAQVRLDAPSLPKNAQDGGIGPYLVGVARDIDATRTGTKTQQHFNWQPTVAGGKVAAISFTSTGAHGVRLGLLVRALPGSAQLRIYSQDKPGTVFEIAGQQVLQNIQANLDAGDTSDEARTWWSPEFGSGEVTIEIELPPGTPAASLDVAVPRLSHIFVPLELPTAPEEQLQAKIGESDACNLDATCYSQYANQRNAVARMIFTSGGSTFVCTGTLLNDATSSGTPYFLTANHCISSQSVASTMQTDWFYRSPSCDSRTLSGSTTRRTGGATMLYTASASDTTFMRLNDSAPSGAFFAGWDANAQSAGTSIVGLHHPSGDLLKASFGTINGQTSCTSTASGFSCSGTSGNFYRVTWSQGTTEGGSSGSAIFKNGTQVVGTLYGGSASCSALTAPDFYGRFDVAYNAGIKQWLASNTSTSTRQPVYRFYNAGTGAHFFTSSTAERDSVIQNLRSFAYEGVAFYAYPATESGQSPVYRFYNTASGAHFYTINDAERSYVQSTLRTYSYEGPIWSAQQTAASGTAPIYRFYRPANNTHFYTINQAERDFVIANYPSYVYEGPAYYAWTGQ
jgi:hypothetical protein